MSEYLSDKPRLLVVKDGDGNIKNFQEFKHNSFGDPTYFKKIENDKILTELYYEYEYDEVGRKKTIKILDKLSGKITIMEYSY